MLATGFWLSLLAKCATEERVREGCCCKAAQDALPCCWRNYRQAERQSSLEARPTGLEPPTAARRSAGGPCVTCVHTAQSTLRRKRELIGSCVRACAMRVRACVRATGDAAELGADIRRCARCAWRAA
eukprot:3674147-Pleurochrysis_carterae.AAC.1